MIVSGKGAEVAPAGIVTVAGTVTRLGSLEVTLTTRSLANAAGMVIVPLTVPWPTVALVGTRGRQQGGQDIEGVAVAGVH